MAFGFGLSDMTPVPTPVPVSAMGSGINFGGQPAGGGVTLGHLLAAIASGAAAGVSNDRGAIGGAGRGFLAGQQQSQQQLDRQLALEDRAMRKQYLGMQMTSMEQEALDKKAEREAAAAQKAAVDTAISDSGMSPPDQANARAFPAAYGQSLFQKPAAPTAAIQEWTAAGKPGTLQSWLDDRSAAGFHVVGDHGFFGRGPLAGTGQGGGSVTPDAFGSALIGPESDGQQFDKNGQPLISSAGAVGKMQVMPNTAKQVAASLGIPYDEHMLRTNPAYNEKLGRAYATQLLSKYGDPALAAAAYNAGPGAVDAWIAAGKPMSGPQALPAETMAYVPKVLAGLNGSGQPAPPAAGARPAAPQTGLVVSPDGVITNQKPIEWVPATQNGVHGQRSILTGKFDPDAGQGTGTWEDVKDAEGQVIGQRNTVSGKFDPSPKGVSISQNADGSWSMQMGGSGLTTPTQTRLQEVQFNASNQLARLDQIQQAFDPKWLTTGPRAQNWWSGIKDKSGIPSFALSPEEKTNLADYTTFRRRTIENFNLTVKEMTGTALSPGEVQRIQGAQPVAGTGIFDGDGPTEFKTKLDDVTKLTRYALIRYHYALKNNLNPLKVTGLDDMPAFVDKRHADITTELKRQQPNASPDAIQVQADDMVRQEFGIPKPEAP